MKCELSVVGEGLVGVTFVDLSLRSIGKPKSTKLEFRRDDSPVHRFSNPMANCSHAIYHRVGLARGKRFCGHNAADLRSLARGPQ